ncbi:hypothetical protein LCGC14_1461860 [marine sediment metagenome]|uniref:Uncharacterized protein n=1 Tax=marine sediment metagenome TaxID=412755 RepID=A0A0F9K0Y2_9ZZZZ
MAIEILCSHGLSPEQTEASLAILTKYIGPYPMRLNKDGNLFCPCGFTMYSERNTEEDDDAGQTDEVQENGV